MLSTPGALMEGSGEQRGAEFPPEQRRADDQGDHSRHRERYR